MMYIRNLFLLTIFLSGCQIGTSGLQVDISLKDKETIQKLNKQIQHHIKIEDRIIDIAKSFIDQPYASHTLDQDSIEHVVVNLAAFDCVTFVESVLSIAFSEDEQGFVTNLERMRYREGRCNGYLSRLHYFSEWLLHNEQLGYLKMVDAGTLAHEYTPDIGYMSLHPEKYPLLKSSPQRVDSLRMLEDRLKQQKLKMVKQEDIYKLENTLQNGDLVAIVTSIPYLDITHTGFALKEQGVVRFIHASSDKQKVVITQNSLHDYVNSISHMIGIIIYRPVM